MADSEKQAADQTAAQPGAVIVPGSGPTAPETQAQTSLPATPAETPQTESQSPFVQTAEAAEIFEQPTSQGVDAPDEVSWTASEFIAHEKSAGWYLGTVVLGVIAAAFIFMITKDAISAAVILVAALVLCVAASKRPRELSYRLDATGVSIGDKRHDFNEFRSYAVVPEGAFSSIVFMPLRRFATITTIYYAPKDEAKIIALLSDHLPVEENKADAVDRFMKRIRF